MKKNTYIFTLLLLVLSLASCSIDNYDAPDAQVKGSLIDEKTGELVGQDIQECGLTVVEQGFANPENQGWKVKNTGEYENDMIFAATYNIRYENGNCFPFSEDNVVLKRGGNTKDFKVTPFIRIVNSSVTRHGDKVIAKFSVEGGKPGVKLSELQLFAFSDMWVGHSVRFSLTSGTDHQSFNPSADIDSSKQYTLEIDLAKDKSSFKYTGKNYYFRIGALADVSGVGTVRFNYGPLVQIAF